MNILYDSSTLLALYVEAHPHNGKVVQVSNKQRAAENSFYISTHSIAELYSQLTSGRRYFIYSAKEAHKLIDIITDKFFRPVNLKSNEYLEAIGSLATKNLTGGIMYDAIISKAANKIKANKLVTINAKHFKRLNFIHNCELVNPLNF